MSTQRDELAWEIFSIDNAAVPDETLRPDFPQEAGYAQHIAEGLHAAGYRKPRTITTVEELDALQSGSVVMSEPGAVWEKFVAPPMWAETGSELLHDSGDLALPATVLYEPTTGGAA